MVKFYLLLFQLIVVIRVAVSVNKLKIAVCLTGQLARLELNSKVRNIFLANAAIGHSLQVFVLLDNDTTDVKQTLWRFDYSSNPYVDYSRQQLKELLEGKISTEQLSGNVKIRTRYMKPPRSNFTVVGDKIPVTEKRVHNSGSLPAVEEESAMARFQNNMRWMASVRECVKWMQAVEYKEKNFFDVVVRLRDDSYALMPWLFDSKIYQSSLVSANFAVHFGVNDHNFAVDRYWADDLFRGITEDYYFNQTLDKFTWVNPEHRIYKVATSKNIPLETISFCDLPLLPLRGILNSTHWRLHPTYAEKILDLCHHEDNKNNHNHNHNNKQSMTCCSDTLLHQMREEALPIEL